MVSSLVAGGGRMRLWVWRAWSLRESEANGHRRWRCVLLDEKKLTALQIVALSSCVGCHKTEIYEVVTVFGASRGLALC